MTPRTETAKETYDRGVLDGQVTVRLDNHDAEIAATNILLAKTVEISEKLTSAVQTLTEARVTDAATRIATAEAVKEAKEAQEAQAQQAWSPTAKLIAALGSIVGVVAVLWAILSSLPA